MIPVATVVRKGTTTWSPPTVKTQKATGAPKTAKVPSARWQRFKRDLKALRGVYILAWICGLVIGAYCHRWDDSLTLLQSLAFGVGMFHVVFLVGALPLFLDGSS